MKYIISITLFMLTSSVLASNTDSGNISAIHFMEDGVLLFYTDGDRTPITNNCATQLTRFAIDGRNGKRQNQISGLLMAYAMQKNISIVGSNDCNAFNGTETVGYIYIVD